MKLSEAQTAIAVYDIAEQRLVWASPQAFDLLRLDSLDCRQSERVAAEMANIASSPQFRAPIEGQIKGPLAATFECELFDKKTLINCRVSPLESVGGVRQLLFEMTPSEDGAIVAGPPASKVAVRYFDEQENQVSRKGGEERRQNANARKLRNYFVNEDDYTKVKTAALARSELRLEAEVRTTRGVRWHQIDVHGTTDLLTGSFHIELRSIDITSQRQASEAIARQAFLDQLTGLANRYALSQEFQKLTGSQNAGEGKLALLYIDLDGFKAVNDRFGHNVGDEVLKQVGSRLTDTLREEDLAVRLGGDEFVILLSNMGTTQQVEFVAEKIRKSLITPLNGSARGAKIAPSIGGSIYPDDGSSLDELLSNADLALYEAKQMGKNRYHYFTTGLEAALERKENLIKEVRTAVSNHDLELHYQPRYNTALQTIGLEALLRCRRSDGRLLKPLEFLEIARDQHLMADVQGWLLEEACGQLAKWRNAGLDTGVSVNLCHTQITDEGLADQLSQAVSTAGIPPGTVSLDVPESALLANEAGLRRALCQLDELGHELFLDDFGSAYINLANLKDYPITTVKIDAPFVAGIGSMDTISMLIGAGKLLNMKIAAEGVETEQQLTWLQQAGVEEFQGFHFNQPMPASEVSEFLAKSPGETDSQAATDS